MFPASESALLFIFASVQVAGLISLICARMTGPSTSHRWLRGMYLCCLVAVGLATMCAIGCNSGWWISCGTTLALMAIGGTLDLGRTAAGAAF